jgi:anti-sigma-K factor RskA
VTESLHALSGAYVVDALDDDERAAFEEHLPGCLDCQAEVASLREATDQLSHVSALAPPPSLRADVLAGIRTIRPLPPETASSSGEEPADTAVVIPLRRHRFRLAALAAAAAVVAVLGVGAVTQPWRDDPPSVSALTPVDRVLAAEDAKHVKRTFADGSSATLVRSVKQGRAVLVTDDMSSPPSGKVFELWLRDTHGTFVPAGLMHDGGDHKVLLEGDAATATAVGITVEPPGGSARPTSDPIALFDFDQAGT